MVIPPFFNINVQKWRLERPRRQDEKGRTPDKTIARECLLNIWGLQPPPQKKPIKRLPYLKALFHSCFCLTGKRHKQTAKSRSPNKPREKTFIPKRTLKLMKNYPQHRKKFGFPPSKAWQNHVNTDFNSFLLRARKLKYTI